MLLGQRQVLAELMQTITLPRRNQKFSVKLFFISGEPDEEFPKVLKKIGKKAFLNLGT